MQQQGYPQDTIDLVLARYRELHNPRHEIEPREDFCNRVMGRVTSQERRRTLCLCIAYASLAILPFAIRELWLLVRNDYFSIGSLPLSPVILFGYGLFIHQITFYIFLAGAISVGLLIFYRNYIRTTKPLLKQIQPQFLQSRPV